jgi:hypothetical protein
MIEINTENTVNAIARCKQLKPKVTFIKDRTFIVHSANNGQTYTVEFAVANGKKLASCECKGYERGYVCYHIIAAATVNIYRKTIERATA